MRVVLHLGSYKTATTFLQQSLAQSMRNRQPQGGKPYLFREGEWVFVHPNAAPMTELRNTLWRAVRQNGNADQARACLTKILQDCKEPNIIFSNEQLSLGQLGLHDAVLYPFLPAVCRFFKESVNADLVFLFTVRNQADFLESAYSNAVKHGYEKPFEKFCLDVELEALDWLDLADKVSSAFGESVPIHIVPMEAVRDNEDQFLRQLSTEVFPGLALSSAGKRMPRLSSEALEFCRLAYMHLDAGKKFAFGKLIAERPELFPEAKGRMLPKMFADALLKHHAEANRQLFAKYVDPVWHRVEQYYQPAPAK